MDHQLCQFEATIVWSPAILKIGEDMILSIQCYMLPRAMHTNSFMCSVIPQAKKKNSSSNDKLVEEISELRKVALLQLFQTLGMKPVRSAIQRMNINGGDTAYDMIIQTINTKEDDASKEKGEDDPLEDKDEKKEVTDDQLDSIYEKAQVFDSQITPMEQPETMALELKEYQKRVRHRPSIEC
jgi:DNA repair protein RAD5